MTQLIANLGTGKGTWAYLKELIDKYDWETIFLITNHFGAENFAVEGKEINFILIDDRKELSDLVDAISAQLKGRLSITDAAINLVSGTGKEHMALLTAVLNQGIGIRLIGLKHGKVEEI